MYIHGEGIAVRKSLRASTSYLHPRPSTPQTSSSCRSPSSCKTCFRALATTCFLLLRKALSSTLRSKPRRTASSSGLGRYRSQGSGGTCIAQPLVGEAHSDCRINSLLPTPKAILYTTPVTTPVFHVCEWPLPALSFELQLHSWGLKSEQETLLRLF